MRSFYLVYGTLLLLVSVAFSYLESRSKDQRILKAKVAHAYQLARDKECREAFNLLTQYKQPFLATYYEGKSPDQMQQLESRLCKALQNAKSRPGKVTWFNGWKVGNKRRTFTMCHYQQNLVAPPVSLFSKGSLGN